jgi:hypothetical protein
MRRVKLSALPRGDTLESCTTDELAAEFPDPDRDFFADMPEGLRVRIASLGAAACSRIRDARRRHRG